MSEMWFLVMISAANPNYIGPFKAEECQAAAVPLANAGVVCKQADYYMMCAVDGRPGTFMACPAFKDGPKVTVRP